MTKSTKLFFLSVIFFLILTYNVKANPQKKLVVITISGATLEDLLSSKQLRDIANEGCIGLINMRSSGSNNLYKPCLTLGSGQKSEVSYELLNSIKVDSSMKLKYENLTLNPCIEGNIVNLSINKIIQVNSNTLYNALPGKLGSALRSKGYKTAFIGGFWHDGFVKSPAFFIAMDKYGLSDYGELDTIFANERIDNDKLIEAFLTYKDKADFIVIELGEIESLFNDRNLYTNESYNVSKNIILSKYDEILNIIRHNIDFESTTLCVVSPYSFDVLKQDTELLSPIIIFNGGKTRGLLTSRTTRRPGILSDVDFAPYVLRYFDLNAEGYLGYPIERIFETEPILYITDLNSIVTLGSMSRSPILKGLALLIIAILIIFVLKIIKNSTSCTSVIDFLMEFTLIVPLFILIEGILGFSYTAIKAAFIIAASLIFTITANIALKKRIDRIILITFLVVTCLVSDMITGQNMLKYSVLSYDPIIGARFYGIGNEFLGVIIGCGLVFSGSILEKNQTHKKRLVLFLITLPILIGLPWFGANIGGLITAMLGFVIFILMEYKYSLKSAAKIGIISSVLSLILVLGINLIKGAESHLGKMIGQAQSNGLLTIYNMAYRKASMAVRLIRYTIWSKVLVAFIISVSVFSLKHHYLINNLFMKNMHMKNVLISGLISCTAAILFNDSGIVTAAMIMPYVFFSMFLLSDS